jgi:hypothetical protein
MRKSYILVKATVLEGHTHAIEQEKAFEALRELKEMLRNKRIFYQVKGEKKKDKQTFWEVEPKGLVKSCSVTFDYFIFKVDTVKQQQNLCDNIWEIVQRRPEERFKGGVLGIYFGWDNIK